MNNNIEVMKLVWRRAKRPSAAKLRRIKAKAELEARVTLRYMALLAAVLTMLLMAFAPMVHGQDVELAVFNHQIMSGMAYGNVLASWGKPAEVRLHRPVMEMNSRRETRQRLIPILGTPPEMSSQ
jgi:hypothetical protein